MQFTSTELIYAALRKIGQLRAGWGGSPEDLADGLAEINGMLDSWQTQRLLIYEIAQNVYSFPSSKQSYSIGPSGADITAPRPERIESANILLIQNPSSPTRSPITIITSLDWSQIPTPAISTDIPLGLYMDNAYPNANLYLYPFPTTINQLELFTWQALSQFADLVTPVNMPPGYYNALVLNLAVMLAPMFHLKQNGMLNVVERQAREALQKIKNINAPTYEVLSDYPGTQIRAGYFNYLTGLPQ